MGGGGGISMVSKTGAASWKKRGRGIDIACRRGQQCGKKEGRGPGAFAGGKGGA